MSNRPPKPEGMAWVNPYLIVKDVAESVEFYEKAFGFETKLTIPGEDGKITHAEVSHKNQIIMMGAESEMQKSRSPKTLGGTPVSLYLYVDDVNKFYEQAKAAGAIVKAELSDQFWGDRMCAFESPDGHSWTFATNVADMDMSKAPK